VTVGAADLRAIMYPRSIAIVGASDRPDSRGHQVVGALLRAGYEGTVYPVGRRGGRVHGLTVYPSLADVPGPVDLVASQVSIAAVPDLLECAPALGFKGLVIFADGFGDLGEAGPGVEAESRAAARRHGVRLIGPNTMGLFCAASHMDVIGSATPIPTGPIGLISQSGNVGITVMLEARDHGSGLSHFWGIGRQGDVSLHECILSLADDDTARVIATYAEGIKDGQAFLDAVRRVAPVKPIVILKAGSTASGGRAAASHSGSLAVEDRVLDAACRQAGAVRVVRSDELVPVAIALAQQPPARGRRAALFGSGGGHSVEMGDAADRAGLEVPPLPPETSARLRALVPEFGSAANPSDFAGGRPERGYPMTFADAAAIALGDDSFDGLVMFGLWGGWRPEQLDDDFIRASEIIARLGREADKPVVMHTIYAREPHAGNRALQRLGVPTMESIEMAARCFAALADYGAARARLARPAEAPTRPGARALAERVIRVARDQGRRALLESEAQQILTAYGVPALPHVVARTRSDVARLATQLGFPLAVKVQAPTVLHKSDVGGVRLGVRTPEAAERAFDAVVAVAGSDIDRAAILYRMAEPDSVELLLGLWRDPLFGPVVVVGLGGIFAEVLGDVSLRIAPFGLADAHEMLDSLRGARLLAGARGRQAVDRAAVTDAMLGLARLATECPDIAEVDVNPLFATASGVASADARMILAA
jgi:acetate---CoA ligase (ADP-forming)